MPEHDADGVQRLRLLEANLIGRFRQLSALQQEIHLKLASEADGKVLKGNELVGWLGEIYGKMLLGGELVNDREEHDFVCPDGRRVSVKTRKGTGSGWTQTSAIPKIEGDDCPTHLMFVHLNDDYSLDRIWLYPWEHLTAESRFSRHIVRGQHRSFIFRVNERNDRDFVVYSSTEPLVLPQPSPATNDAASTLSSRVAEFAAARDWDQFHSPKNLAMALSVEAAELLEHFQWLSEEQSRTLSPEKVAEVETEMADVFIYLLRLSDKLGVDLMAAAERKLAANAEKYPVAKAKGNAKKYTEFEE